MTWVKVCGITSKADASAAIDAGVSAIGLVFAPSPRRVTPEQAMDIAAFARGRVQVVGVFNDSAMAEGTHDAIRFDLIQLHGDAVVGRPVPVLRAVHPEKLDTTTVDESETLLVDGSEGRSLAFDWSRVRSCRGRFVIAGGLNPSNVAEAVALARPFGVDVSSGVERAPGLKDREKMARFVEAARRIHASR